MVRRSAVSIARAFVSVAIAVSLAACSGGALSGGAPDFALHTALVKGVLPDLIKIVDGDPRRVMSFSDFDEGGLGVRTTGREKGVVHRYDVLGDYAQLAAEGRFTVPIARTFSLEDWREAAEISMSKRAHGKLMLLLDPSSTTRV